MPSDWPSRFYWSPNPARRSPRQGRYRRRLGPVFNTTAGGPRSRSARRPADPSTIAVVPPPEIAEPQPMVVAVEPLAPVPEAPIYLPVQAGAPTSEVAQSEPPPLPPRKPVANQPPKPIMRRPPASACLCADASTDRTCSSAARGGWRIARSGAAIGRGSHDAGSGFRGKLPGHDQRLVRDPQNTIPMPRLSAARKEASGCASGSTALAECSIMPCSRAPDTRISMPARIR
jgi:hypothetical protein